MEVIRVPNVSLVDRYGKRIGIYNDDSGWWEQVQHRKNNNVILTASNTQLKDIDSKSKEPKKQKRSGKVSPQNSDDTAQSSSSKTMLIGKDDLESKEEDENFEFELPINQEDEEEDDEEELNVLGETLLHIAIMYDDLKTIKFLIEQKGVNVHQRCVGGKFSGGFNSKLTSKLIKESEYDNLAYYGEYPLAIAACFSTKDIYDYLIDQGADPNLKDTNGNTVLHVLVINDMLEMFQYVTNHPKKKGLLTIKNNQDLTPVTLAAKIGRKDLFENMLELKKKEIWSWSTTQCSVYPVEGLDTLHNDGTILSNSALSYIVHGESKDHLDMLEIGIIKRLLSDKWATYAQKKFFKRLILAIVHLILLSIAVYTRPSDSPNLAKWPVTSAITWVRYISELGVVVICIFELFIQGKDIYKLGFKLWLNNLFGDPANVLYQIFCILIILAVPFRFVTFPNSADTGIYPVNVEDTFFILAIPCGWAYLLFFARVFEITGPFVVMIYKMIIGDILSFSIIYSLLLFGFSLAFYYLYKNANSAASETMKDYGEAIMVTFQMTLGDFKERMPEFDEIYYKDFTKCVFTVFMLLMHVLLLNLLIAMMGNTYHQVIVESAKEYRKQWSNMVLLLERSFDSKDLRKFQEQYCVKIPNKKTKEETTALLIIKEKPKTKAFMRANAIKKWKKFYKLISSILKDEDISAIQLLDRWGYDEIKIKKKRKEKKPFDWSQYDPKPKPGEEQSEQPETNQNIKVETQIQKTNNTFRKENSKSELAKVNTNEKNSLINQNSLDKAKSPTKTPTPIKLVSNGETKEMSSKNVIDFNGKNEEKTEKLEKQEKVNATSKQPLKTQDTKASLITDPLSTTATSKNEKNTDEVEEIDTANRPSSAIKALTRPSSSQKKTFFPVQTNRLYSPITNSFTTVNNTLENDLKNLDLSDIKKPLSSHQNKDIDGESSYIRDDNNLPAFQPKILENTENKTTESNKTDGEDLSTECESMSIKPPLSPDSDVTKQTNETS